MPTRTSGILRDLRGGLPGSPIERKRWGKVLALDPTLYRECLDEGLVDYPADCASEPDDSSVSNEIPF
jgi:hypothetical protein